MKNATSRSAPRAAFSTDNSSNLDPLVLSQSPAPAQAIKPQSRKVTLDEPVTVASFWKNRRHDAVVISLTTYEGHNLVDLRTHFMNKEGKLQPTPKGLALAVLRLPELAAAVAKALTMARELGLLEEASS